MSLPIAVATSEELPSARMIAWTRIVKATAEPRPTIPYVAAGAVFVWCSPTHSVVTGISDSQNSRCRLDHITPADIRRAARSRWWWLFQ